MLVDLHPSKSVQGFGKLLAISEKVLVPIPCSSNHTKVVRELVLCSETLKLKTEIL